MTLKSLLLGAVLAAGGMIAMSAPASAWIVCNRWGDCWHSETRIAAPGLRFEYYPDDWYFHRSWGPRDRWRWREGHPGRGYWRNGVWITF